MYATFRRTTNQDLVARVWDREHRVIQTVLTDNTKKSAEMVELLEKLNSMTDKIRDIFLREYYNLCKCLLKVKEYTRDIILSGEYDDSISDCR
jgi:hypothetical protein